MNTHSFISLFAIITVMLAAPACGTADQGTDSQPANVMVSADLQPAARQVACDAENECRCTLSQRDGVHTHNEPYVTVSCSPRESLYNCSSANRVFRCGHEGADTCYLSCVNPLVRPPGRPGRSRLSSATPAHDQGERNACDRAR